MDRPQQGGIVTRNLLLPASGAVALRINLQWIDSPELQNNQLAGACFRAQDEQGWQHLMPSAPSQLCYEEEPRLR